MWISIRSPVMRSKGFSLLPALISLPPAMSVTDTHGLPPEIWTHILKSKHGLSLSDFKQMSFVCKLFRSICQPEAFKSLRARQLFHGNYSYGPECDRWMWWERDAAGIIRSERRIALIGNDPFLCGMPKRWLISGGEGPMVKRIETFGRNLALPYDSRSFFPMSDAILRLMSRQYETLAHNLHHFRNLTKLSLLKVCLTEDLMTAMSSHPALIELMMDKECTLPANPPLLANLRALDYDIGQNQRTEKILRAILPSTVILRASLSIPCCDTFQWICDTMKDTPFQTLTRLHLELKFHTPISLLSYALSLAPILQTLIIEEEPYLEDAQADVLPGLLPSETGTHIRSITCSVAKAKAIVPGRPVEEIRLDTNKWSPPPSLRLATCSNLSAYFEPLSWSTASITVLCLPDQLLAPVRALSLFVTETFPVLRELKMMVSYDWCHPSFIPEDCSKEMVEEKPIKIKKTVEINLMDPDTLVKKIYTPPRRRSVTQALQKEPPLLEATQPSVSSMSQEPKDCKGNLGVSCSRVHPIAFLAQKARLATCVLAFDAVFLLSVCNALSERYSALEYADFKPKSLDAMATGLGLFKRIDGRGPAVPEWKFIPRPSRYD